LLYSINQDYEVVGMIPVGTAYMVMKNKKISKVAQLRGQRVGVLANNPPQQALVSSVGAQPVYVDLSNAIAQYCYLKFSLNFNLYHEHLNIINSHSE